MEADVEKEIKATGKAQFGLKTYVRIEVEKRLAAMAGIPSYEEWEKEANKDAPSCSSAN
jgi:hypothetical protein